MHITEKTYQIELVDESKSTLREAMRAACLHEEASQGLKTAGEGVSGVLHRTAKEVHASALAQAKENGIDAPTGDVLAVLFAEALHDAEESIREESSAFKHLKKLPRAWINAKSQLVSYFEYDQVDWDLCPTVSKVKKWNNDEKTRRASESARQFLKDTGQKPELVSDKDDAPSGDANIEVSKTKTKDVKISPVDTDGLKPEVVELLVEIAASCHSIDPTKAVKMLTGFKGQLDGVAKKAMAGLAKAS